MLFWFVGFALAVTWLVFRDPAIDYRLLVAGALLPDVVDGLAGGAWVAHTLLAAAVVLVLVMALTRRPASRPGPSRRQARRRWLAVPIGMFLHLVADGVWTDTATLWWPFTQARGGPLPSFGHAPVLTVVEELAGLAGIAWFVWHFRLTDPAVRSSLVRTGRLPREQAG